MIKYKPYENIKNLCKLVNLYHNMKRNSKCIMEYIGCSTYDLQRAVNEMNAYNNKLCIYAIRIKILYNRLNDVDKICIRIYIKYFNHKMSYNKMLLYANANGFNQRKFQRRLNKINEKLKGI